MPFVAGRPAGRPRNPELDRAILAAAERQLGEVGYARMSLDSIAAQAGTTVPAVRRRFRGKAEVVIAVIESLRIQHLPEPAGPPRERALTLLRNFHANLGRTNSMAVVGSLLTEERRHPELLEAFRRKLVEPRRQALRRILDEAVNGGELGASVDSEVLASMLIGAFYARYIASSDVPEHWPESVLRHIWPAPCGHRCG